MFDLFRLLFHLFVTSMMWAIIWSCFVIAYLN